ncbi:MAG: ribulose-phosphate 3-epimerase [Candidatus Pacearchaeota archaeon]
MKKEVVPALIAKNKKELEKRFKVVKKSFKTIHLDFMDGKFVKNKSLMFSFKLPKKDFRYRAHLMVSNPEAWIKKNSKFVDSIIFHHESVKNPEEVIKLIRKKKKKVGIAINPKTKVEKISSLLKKVDFILIMTVNPGKYGSKFQKAPLAKIRDIRKIKSKMKIIIDGGMNPKTIKIARKKGANSFVVGSCIQKAKNPEEVIKKLKQ